MVTELTICRDATDRQSWIDLHADIKRTLPQLGGIANGAMVLRDRLFLDMDLETIQTVLQPKVDVSIYLDEIFSDTPLDFFVMFSSLAAVVGNRGQSNYCAANLFMASLARQRKSRGLAGSTINIGRLIGLGYLERIDQTVDEILTRSKFMKVSEVDFLHSFAQAVMAGLPSSTENPEVIMALQPVREDEMTTVPWHADPRLSHMILEVPREEANSKSKDAVLSVRARLEAATTETEAFEAIEGLSALVIRRDSLLIPFRMFLSETAAYPSDTRRIFPCRCCIGRAWS